MAMSDEELRLARKLLLVEQIAKATTTPEMRALAAAAIETYEAQRQGLAPLLWSEVKDRLLEAALAFGKLACEKQEGA